MEDDDWSNGFSRSIGVLLAKSGTSPLLILLNAYHEDLEYRTPQPRGVVDWRLIADSARGLIEPGESAIEPGSAVNLPARGVLLFEGHI